jgi:hypothetical protein
LKVVIFHVLLAQLILNAAYESTFLAAIRNLQKTGNNKLYLTQLGGGAFGNNKSWIINAIRRSILKFKNFALDVKLVSYGSSDVDILKLCREF